MSAHVLHPAHDANTAQERESRIRLALLRGVLENLKDNRRLAPIMALTVAAMFSQWVSTLHLLVWVMLVMIASGLQLLTIKAMPAGELLPQMARQWTIATSAANLL